MACSSSQYHVVVVVAVVVSKLLSEFEFFLGSLEFFGCYATSQGKFRVNWKTQGKGPLILLC